MQKMFHGNYVAMAKVEHVAKTQTIIADLNVADVNKAIEEHVLKDKEPRKAKNVVDWEKENI
jgi:hypothetical protein